MPDAYREPPPRSADSKARCETVRDATSTSGKLDVQERPPPEPDDERAAKTPRRDVEDTSMLDPGGAPSSSSAAASSTPPDPCETTPARPTRRRSPDPPIGESPATPLPKRLRSVSVDDSGMVAALAEVTEVCEEPQPHWEALASSENVGSTWFMRRHGAWMVHLGHLREHRVYEELDLPQGVKPLSIRWVDKDDYHTAKARLTARGYEQELTGQENFYSATPQPATLRLLLVVGPGFGTGCGSWRLCSSFPPSSPSREERGMGHTTTGSGSETWTSMAVACRLGPPRNECQGSALWIGLERARSLCTQHCA